MIFTPILLNATSSKLWWKISKKWFIISNKSKIKKIKKKIINQVCKIKTQVILILPVRPIFQPTSKPKRKSLNRLRKYHQFASKFFNSLWSLNPNILEPTARRKSRRLWSILPSISYFSSLIVKKWKRRYIFPWERLSTHWRFLSPHNNPMTSSY